MLTAYDLSIIIGFSFVLFAVICFISCRIDPHRAVDLIYRYSVGYLMVMFFILPALMVLSSYL